MQKQVYHGGTFGPHGGFLGQESSWKCT